jgi:uncharacterized protein YehS (DUF1456 family)
MLGNDVIRRLRYALDLRDRHVAEIARKGGSPVTEAEVKRFLLREYDDDYLVCSDEVLTGFLDGLILHLRGEREGGPVKGKAVRVLANNNNRVLCKLRIAFDQKDEGMLALLETGGFRMSKSELSALFRKEAHKHYRECGDQVLRYFIVGLTKERRPDVASEPPAESPEGQAISDPGPDAVKG